MKTKLFLTMILIIVCVTSTFLAAQYPVSAADCGNNASPIVRAGEDISIARGGTAQFDGSASFDQNGDQLFYRWDFDIGNGIGTDATGTRASWTGYQTGSYTVTLQVSDGCTTVSDSLTVTVKDGLFFDLTASTARANPGEGIGYTVTTSNRSGRQINNAIITLDFDERYLTATELNGGILENGRLIYRQERVNEGFSETRAFWFKISDQMPYGETALSASATFSAHDYSNQYSRNVQTAVSARPTLVIALNADKSSVGRGDTISFVLTYQNHGTTKADEVRVRFDYDEAVVDVTNASGNVINESGALRWDVGNFYPEQKSSQTVTLRVRIQGNQQEMKNLVRISAANANNFDQVITTSLAGANDGHGGLQIKVTASDENEFYASSLSSHHNELVTFHINVTNDTGIPAEFVSINMDYDEIVFTLSDRGDATNQGTDVSWEIARLETGETRTFQAKAIVRTTAPYYRAATNRVSVSARNSPTSSSNVITTITEGDVKVKGYTTDLPRTGGSFFPLIGALSALAGITTYLKNGRKFIGS